MSGESGKQQSVQVLVVGEEAAGQRIDNYLLKLLKGVPKSRIYRLLRKGEVRVNKGRIKPEYKLMDGDSVRVPPIRVAERTAPEDVFVSDGLSRQLQGAILFEDERLLIINKPSGLAVHGGSGVSVGLIEALRRIRPEERFLELVHRLDRDTSGCVMLAKKRSTLKTLHGLLRGNGVDKRYLALVEGRWSSRKVQVKLPLEKNVLQSGERMVRVNPDGKYALTRFEVVQRFPGATLVEARPVTGRTHQIRVHCQAAGHPIIGDDKYGRDEVNEQFRKEGVQRLFLHAHSLGFELDGERISVAAELSDDLNAYIKKYQ
ncbi:MAG TPA: 23S rRNA pseudouridine(955/2504/2580) synthase RluC [Spongiibacteraceae bacterium]|nr:23S rRNA pseudouridine(955/2504/2580) synthase RluC [Spongiibacteraceae bacterium]HCS26036.1 23S rRNA pseudouridine(955/2504/2580) synthase RluC [Spongiibacteraceae bacterium]